MFDVHTYFVYLYSSSPMKISQMKEAAGGKCLGSPVLCVWVALQCSVPESSACLETCWIASYIIDGWSGLVSPRWDSIGRIVLVTVLLCVESRVQRPLFLGGTGSANCDSASGAQLESLPRVGPRDSESALFCVRICQQLEGRLIKFMNDTKLGWKTNMSDNKIKIHKNPERNDGPVTNKINPNRIWACSWLGLSCQCLPAMEEHGQFGDLGKPMSFPDVNCKLIMPHTWSTAALSLLLLEGFPLLPSHPFFFPPQFPRVPGTTGSRKGPLAL